MAGLARLGVVLFAGCRRALGGLQHDAVGTTLTVGTTLIHSWMLMHRLAVP